QARSSDPGYFGMRRWPYSTDHAINPLTYRHMRASEPLPTIGPHDLNPNANQEVHNAGEVWAQALWEAYVALQDAGTSFDTVRATMARYVVAGLQMMPGDATPLEARDALLAVAAANRSDDARVMAQAFARRGFGSCAIAAPRTSKLFDE